MLSKYEQKLLEGWEEVYKKAQLTLWILLALKEQPKHMAEIKAFISEATDNNLAVDDKSMYRALRRYHKAEIVDFSSEASQSGPDRKIYRLTDIGKNVLAAFVKNNIKGIYFNSKNKELFR